ncbi:MAG: hypothetical protein AB1649_18840, partial [Chloroflexota bacterium]
SLYYPTPESVDALDASARAYILLFQGVLGAVMFGWSAALLLVLLGPFRRGFREGWMITAVSLVAWFIPDTAFSLWTGFWLNAALNGVFLLMFAIPLAATAPTYLKSRQSIGGQYEHA